MSIDAQKRIILSQDTLMPVSFAITIIGFSYWITNIASMANQNSIDISRVRTDTRVAERSIMDKIDNQTSQLTEVREKLSAIDSKLSLLISIQKIPEDD